MARIWVVGPIAWDLAVYVPRLPARGGFVQASRSHGRPGGTGANTAMAVASAGIDVAMVGYVGDDDEGSFLFQSLRTAGVDAAHVKRLPGPSSHVALLIDEAGARTMVGLQPDRLDQVPIPTPDVCTGDLVYFAAMNERAAASMTTLSDCGVTIVSVPPETQPAGLPVDYLVGSAVQFGAVDAEAIYAELYPLTEDRLRAVVVTQGANGVAAFDGKRRLSWRAITVDATDTTGAGDAFAAGFLVQVQRGASLEQAVTQGIRWGSAAVTNESSVPPPWKDVVAGEGMP